MQNEQEYYTPKFFTKQKVEDKNGKAEYLYKPREDNLYWELRERQDWSSLPHIFQDDCEPFY